MHRIAFAIAALLSIFITLPAWAQSEIVITQAKALAGNVTPGDTAGFPVTLSQPGAYILGSNLAVPGYTYGIIATTNNVDIDMNGFRLAGNNFGTYGVVSNYGESRIRNGFINTFRNAGIYLRGNGWTIEDMKIVRNGGAGVDATGASLITVRNSIVSSNRSDGVKTGDFGHIENSTVTSNSGYGLSMLDYVVIESSTVSKNSYAGIFMTGGGRVEGNDVDGNGAEGIIVQGGGIITANSVRSNISYGIYTTFSNSSISNNSLINNSVVGSNSTQINGGRDTYGNTCVGKPCF